MEAACCCQSAGALGPLACAGAGTCRRLRMHCRKLPRRSRMPHARHYNAPVVDGAAPVAACCSSLLSAGRAGGADHPHLQAIKGIGRECQVHDA